MKRYLVKITFAMLVLGSINALAGGIPYGTPINLETAKKVVKAASEEMNKKNLDMTIVVVDSGGNLVYLERADQAPIGTVDAAIGKAKASNGIKLPTKEFEDQILNGNKLNLLGVPGAFPIEGGVPIVEDNKIIGAIGASGGMPSEDGEVADAGANILKKR